MYVESIDPSKPLGKLILNYVNKKWWNGFSFGFCSGIIYSYLLVMFYDKKFPKH
jgi:hypothetical protein